MTSVDEVESGSGEGVQNGASKGCQPTNLESQIIRQIEFYFGDANLPRDKFMLEQIKLDDGWIPMSTMLKFQRLAGLSTDAAVIAEALKKSDLMEVDTEGVEVKVRRSPAHPLPELNAERRKEIAQRTIYSKGFPLDSTLDSVMTVLEPFGKIDNIIMRKYKDSVTQKYLFKGSIFATFPTKEKAQAYLDVPSVKVGETELVRLWINDYNEKKKQELNKNKKQKQEPQEDPLSKTLKKGSIIKLVGEFNPETTREDIKSALTLLEIDVAYIGFSKGEKEAFLRLHEENSAKSALEKLGNELTVLEVKLSASEVEGKEEEDFLKKALEDKKHRHKQASLKKKGGRGKKRGSRGDEDGPPSKKPNRR